MSKRRARARRSSSSMNSAAITESWEPQMRYFTRRHRCISYAARGYPPSDVPDSVEAYSQARARDESVAVLDALKVDEGAHRRPVDGRLLRGAFRPAHAGARAVARRGRRRLWRREGSSRSIFRGVSLEVAEQFEKQGMREFAEIYALGAEPRAVPEQGSARLAGIRRPLGQHSSTAPPTPCAACRRAVRRSTISRTA